LLVCPQSQTERVLCEAVQNEPAVEVRFWAEATDLDRRTDGVAVTYERDGTVHTVTGAFAAGCDGAHSRVRETAADSFEGMTYDVQAALVPALRGAGLLLQPRPLWRAVLRRMAMLEDPSRTE
jgi:2-polyprenyl-6-methoxyphenol hydroxylase-like FAD-dependent oxidoreductase